MTEKLSLPHQTPSSAAEFIQKTVAAIQAAVFELSTTTPAAVGLTATARTTRPPQHASPSAGHQRCPLFSDGEVALFGSNGRA